MPVDTLATAADLTDFPGHPYDEDLVQIAVESIRAEAGWHIAPARVETLRLYGHGSSYLPIPSRRIVSVEAVRYGPDLDEYTSGWTLGYGGLYLRSGWPCGVVEVDLTHGYDETPLDLLPVIAYRVSLAAETRDPSVESSTEVAGPFTYTQRYGRGGSAAAGGDPRIERYALLPGVA